MSLRNMHVNANVPEDKLLSWAKDRSTSIKHTFKHLVASGSFSFAGFKLVDNDLNRIHAVFREVDTRRVFWYCGDDESPTHAKSSILEARNSIREKSNGIWSNRDAETLVGQILQELATCQQEMDSLSNLNGSFNYDNMDAFFEALARMRMNIWPCIAALSRALDGAIVINNIPEEINELL